MKISYRSLSILCLFFNTIFAFMNPDAYFGIADYYYFIIGFIIFFLLSKKSIKRDNVTNIIYLIMIYNVVSIFIALFFGVFSTGYIFSYYLYLILALLMYSMDFNKKEINKLIDGYIYSAVIISIYMLIQKYDFYGGGNVRHTIRFLNHQPFDPNFLAAFLVFPTVLSFARAMNKSSIKNILFSIVSLFGVFYTSSRGAMISVTIGIVCVLLEFFKNNKKIKRLLQLIVIAIISLYVLKIFVPQNSLIRLFDFASYRDRSNDKRIFDWLTGINAFKKNPLIGYGLQGEMSIINSVIGIKYISHNTYIALLLQLGIVGTIIPVYAIINILWKARNDFILLGSCFSSLFVSIFVSAESSLFFWLPIIYTLVITKYTKNSKEKEYLM